MKPNNSMFNYIKEHDMIDSLISYSAYMHRLTGLSLFNCATLLVQKPGIGFATTETQWRVKFDRFIKPDARPLIVMKPFEPLVIYYEACDTYHPDNRSLPDWIINESTVTSSKRPLDIPYGVLIPILEKHGIYYSESDFGVNRGGEMCYMKEPITLQIPKRNKKNEVKFIECKTHYAMCINSKSDDLCKVRAIFHEIGHLLCGHLKEDEELKKNNSIRLSIAWRDRSMLTEEIVEYEAEKTCELIMNALGFEFDHEDYFDNYKINGQEPDYNLGVVVAAADHFLSWLNESSEARKLVYDWNIANLL